MPDGPTVLLRLMPPIQPRLVGVSPHSVLVPAALLGACLVASGCSDVQEATYADMRAATRDAAMERGWFPPIVPDDATDLHERHNLDTNHTIGCFTATSGLAEVRSSLSARSASTVPGPVVADPSLGRVPTWWPHTMTNASTETYLLREADDRTVRVGLDAASSKVCFSRP